jgi:HSP20 family protein
MFLYKCKHTFWPEVTAMSSIVPRTRTPAPTTTFEDAFSQMDRLFDQLRGDLFGTLWTNPGTNHNLLPALTDVEDKGNAYHIQMDLPGIPKEKIDIRLNGTLLTVDAQNESSKETEDQTYLRRERSYVGFHRAFELPEPVLSDKVDASYRDGVLDLTVPKARPVTEQRIAVN